MTEGSALGTARPGRLTPWLLACVSVAVQLPIYDRSLVEMDEGHLLATAERVLSGEILYRDLHTGIFPAIYYVVAGLLAAFGHDLVVTRIAQVGVNTGVVLLLERIGSRFLGGGWRLAPPLLHLSTVILGFPVFSMLNYSSLSMAFGLGCLLAALRYVERGRAVDGAAVGACLAACALLKQNYGAFTAISTTIVLWTHATDPGARGLARLLPFRPVLAGGIVVTLIGLAPIAAAGALGAMLRQTAIELVPSQLATHHVPVPGLFAAYPADDALFQYDYLLPAFFDWWVHGEAPFGLHVTGPIRDATIRATYWGCIAVATAALAIGVSGRSRVPASVHATATHAAVFFLGLFPSAIWLHLAYVLPPLLLVATWLVRRSVEIADLRDARAGRAIRGALVGGALLIALPTVRFPFDLRRWNDTPLALPGAHVHLSAARAAPLRRAHEFLVACAAEDEPVLVLPAVPLLYVTTGRRNPTPYDLTIPGNVREVELIRDLEDAGVACIVRDPRMPIEYPSFASLFPAIEAHLRAEFRLLPGDPAASGRPAFERWVRRGRDGTGGTSARGAAERAGGV